MHIQQMHDNIRGTDNVLVTALVIDSTCPILSPTLNLVDTGVAIVGIVIYPVEVVEIPFHSGILRPG